MNSSSLMIQTEDIFLANSKFESYDELLKSVRDFYYAKGYGVSIRDSRKDKYVTLQYDRGGSYRDRLCIGDKRKKNIGSRLIQCPFQIVGKKGNDGAWVLHAKNLTHNHEPSDDISGHPSVRRLSTDDVQSVKNMTLSGIAPRQILSSLRQKNQNLPAVSRTIYNLKAKICKKNLKNRSMVSALFEEFVKEGFIYDILHNSVGHITHLFIAHPLSIKLAKVFSNIFVMDCTYKTNKYNMPLIDIIGVSCFNTMGLPCVHKIKHLQGMPLSLDLIHSHWRIDTLRLNSEDDSHNDGANEFDELLSELSSRYQMWPLSKKEFATSTITKLLTESNTFFEPMIRQPNGRPPKTKKKRGITSTARDPSRFELVESSQTPITSSSTRAVQLNNEVYDNVSYISYENNLLDLNAYPTFSSDDMSYE